MRRSLYSSRHHEVARQLVPRQHEAGGHQCGIRNVGVAQVTRTRPPVSKSDQDRRQRKKLPDLHAAVEAHDVRDQAVPGEWVLLQLRGEAETVDEAEHEDGDAVFGWKPSALKPPMFSKAL